MTIYSAFGLPFFVLFWSALSLPKVQADQRLEVLLVEKAPYYYTDQGEARGFLYERFKCMLESAHIPVSFNFQPINRILYRIKNDQEACSLGWFRIPSREAFATFSERIWEERQMGILVHKDSYKRIAAFGTLEKMLAAPELRAVIPENVSFGHRLDQMLGRSKNIINSSTINFFQSLTMVGSKRVDYTIVTLAEYSWHKKNNTERVGKDRLELVMFADMPGGEQRYLMCNKKIDAKRLDSINQAILTYRRGCDLRIPEPQ